MLNSGTRRHLIINSFILLCSFFLSALVYAADSLDSQTNINATKSILKKEINDKTIREAHERRNLYSPVGYWLQYTGDGKQAQSILHIYESKDGKLEGKIVVPFINMIDGKKTSPNVVCIKCGKGDENGYEFDYSSPPDNQIQGLEIMWGFVKDGKRDGSNGPLYNDGSILDPSNGKVYSSKIQTQAHGQKLYVRGYIGFSLFGRTQYWYRINQTQAQQCVSACGLTVDGHYPYTDKTGKIIDEELWQQCSNITLKESNICKF